MTVIFLPTVIVVSSAAVFWHITQRSFGGTLRDMLKNGGGGDYGNRCSTASRQNTNGLKKTRLVCRRSVPVIRYNIHTVPFQSLRLRSTSSLHIAYEQAHLWVTGASGEEQSNPAGRSLVKRRQEIPIEYDDTQIKQQNIQNQASFITEIFSQLPRT